ncbi:MAG: EVE domain-containing protein [Bdellovibrionales bacterium]|nr:EVE domain-containing protein [Bdellovibrionales bacterium]
MAIAYWLLKTEPETYSFARLEKDRRTNWNDVRNFQARNFLKAIKKGDSAVIYHSGDDKAVVGIAECVREGYPDIDADDGKEWVQIDIAPVKALAHPVPLATIKSTGALKDLPLIRQSRLSVMPITKAHFETLVALSKAAPSATLANPAAKKRARKQ